MSIHYSPLRYPGGKNCIFSFVSHLIENNNLLGGYYAEPYAGGAGLAIRLLLEGYVKHIFINDYDKSIFAFWFSILNNTEEFCNWIDNTEISIENWKKYKVVQNNKSNENYFELAKSTFFLNRTNISGIIKGGVMGGIKQNGKYKIDARFNKIDLINRIKKIASLKNMISLSNLEGMCFLDEINQNSHNTFVYLDPPYFQKGSNLYMNFFSENDHINLSQYIKNIKHKWMISYDMHDTILSLFADEKKIAYKLSQSTSNKDGDEIIIFSAGLNFTDSLSYLRSPVII